MYDLQTVILHENGHVAGLDHLPDCDAVMFGSLRSLETKRSLTDDDAVAISARYPRAFDPLPHEPPLPPRFRG
ncbi:MAG: matrixin family metalloprotease [Acidimicrobiales bacterium]